MSVFRRLLSPLACASALALLAPAAVAQESVVLKFEHFLSSSAIGHTELVTPWCDDLDKASDGRLKCEIYPSMQLGGKPEQLPNLLQNGVIDIAFTAFGYSPGRFPRAEAGELPLVLPQKLEDANAVMWDYMNNAASEDIENFQMLGVFIGGDSGFHTVKTPITKMKDLKGLRIRAATRVIGNFLTALGATPIAMPPAQITDSMSKGVLDGVITVWELVPATKLDETSFEHTEMASDQFMLTASPLTFLMSKKRYESLPDDLRQILDEHSGPALNQRAAELWTRTARQARDKVEDMPDQNIHVVDDAFYADMQDKAQLVYDDWIKKSPKGVDRRVLFDGFRELVQDRMAADAAD